jgi:hypothetical protein
MKMESKQSVVINYISFANTTVSSRRSQHHPAMEVTTDMLWEARPFQIPSHHLMGLYELLHPN